MSQFLDDPVFGRLEVVYSRDDPESLRSDTILAGAIQYSPDQRVTLRIGFDPQVYPVPRVLAGCAEALQRFRAKASHLRMWTASRIAEEEWNDADWPLEDLANSLLVSAFSFAGDGALSVSWATGYFIEIDRYGRPVEFGIVCQDNFDLDDNG